MGLFSTTKKQDSDAPTRNERSPSRTSAHARTVIGIILLIGIPGYLLTLIPAILVFERRRVRTGWYWLWALLSLLVGVVAAGSVTAWQAWLVAWPGHMLPAIFESAATSPESTPAKAAAFAAHSAGYALLCHTIAVAPLAMATCALFTIWRGFSRKTRGRIEGEDHSNERPVGILDRRRIARERRRVAAAHYLPALHITEPTLAQLHAQMADLDANYVVPTTPPPDTIEVDTAPQPAIEMTQTAVRTLTRARAGAATILTDGVAAARAAIGQPRTTAAPQPANMPPPNMPPPNMPPPAGNPFARTTATPAPDSPQPEPIPLHAPPPPPVPAADMSPPSDDRPTPPNMPDPIDILPPTNRHITAPTQTSTVADVATNQPTQITQQPESTASADTASAAHPDIPVVHLSRSGNRQ